MIRSAFSMILTCAVSWRSARGTDKWNAKGPAIEDLSEFDPVSPAVTLEQVDGWVQGFGFRV